MRTQQLRSVIFVCFSALLLLPADSFAEMPADKSRTQIIEIFIAKATEELRLPAEMQSSFAESVKSLHEKRRANGERMDRAVAKLEELTASANERPMATEAKPAKANKAGAALTKALKEYRAAMDEQHRLQKMEMDQMGRVLGPDRFARYLVVKNDLTEKIKEILSKPENEEPPPSAPAEKN